MRYLLAFLAVLVIVTGCAQQQAAPAAQTPTDNPVDTLPAVNTTPKTEPAKEPVIESGPYPGVFDDLPSDVQEILANGIKRSEGGITYLYTVNEGTKPLDTRLQAAKVYQKGDALKLELTEPNTKINKGTYFNTVYVDREAQTVRAYCTDRVNCDALGAERTGEAYTNYVFMTPLDWIKNLEGAKKMEEKTVQNRKAVRLEATVDDKPTTIWVDRYSGIPLEVYVGNRVYKYEQLALGVKDSDLARPQ